MTRSEPLALTEEQMEIVQAPAASRMLVIAPAGSGKTEVVAHRLARLREHVRDDRASDVLVLSFSNAAVTELRRRARHAGPIVAAVPISTLDSYASRMLAIHDPEGDWHVAGYLERMRRATTLIAENDEVRGDLLVIGHLILDEFQDFVGDRAEFVDALICALASHAGYTVLGDPAQGVFDFQLEGSRNTTTSVQFLHRLLAGIPKPEIHTLSVSFRARSKVTARIAALGRVLRDRALGLKDNGDGALESELLSLHTYRPGQVAAILKGVQRDGGTAAVLCRLNGQALVVSRELRSAGIRHRLKGRGADTWVGPWVALLFRGYRFPTISRRSFDERYAELGGPISDVQLAWKALKRAEGLREMDLSLRVLVSRIRTSRLPDELAESDLQPVIVSSIHRAKGLEWDVVFLCGVEVDPDREFDDLRLAYVAMTRARDELFVLAAPDIGGLRSKDQLDGRWIRTDPRTRRITQMEVVPDDVEWTAPAGAILLGEDPVSTQDYLATAVRHGDAVKLALERSFLEGQPKAVYRVEHEGRAIGITSDGFSDSVRDNVRRAGGGGFPLHLEGARVQAIETVGGSSAAGHRAGLGSAGLWLRPRLEGLADVTWRKQQ